MVSPEDADVTVPRPLQTLSTHFSCAVAVPAAGTAGGVVSQGTAADA